ncbi:glutamate--cysteine ligase [Goekera deserti]|uniref:Putative glutamate--cysteine ligase 2 n=1 Tax=Goekera deserti TaxID=2497753 RepID=A0A7K3WIY7_9ACTN|nr:glutamate--cysteine ligase [Goekera deserti]NDI47026.1 YbdK family carboxylate-amine ligase [Goekera deserti]NEL56262.1 YbdK family carboxylate-amine ligase [Goekera deserti]
MSSPAPDVPAVVAGVGLTLGVEEEFHLVDPETLAMTGSSEVADAAVRGQAGPHVQPEISTTQLETATGVCTTLDSLRAELAVTRAEVVAAAARGGLRVLPASTHPFSSWRELRLTDAPRYRVMVDKWASLAEQQDICGMHVHVGVPDLDTAVAVMDRARPYLPVLLAMTGSSPFHGGIETGYESYRTIWWSRWPVSGPPEPMGDADAYRAVVAELVASGIVPDASNLYWDLRPSTHVPTLEFRGGDLCPDVDDVVLHAALARSLVRVLAARAERDEPPLLVRPEVLRSARWRAAREGLSGRLFDPVAGTLVDAAVAVRRLVAELADELADRGELEEVQALTEQLLARGTSAARQLATHRRTGDLRAVAAELVEGFPGA